MQEDAVDWQHKFPAWLENEYLQVVFPGTFAEALRLEHITVGCGNPDKDLLLSALLYIALLVELEMNLLSGGILWTIGLRFGDKKD